MSRFLQNYVSLFLLMFFHHCIGKLFDCVETDECFGQIMICPQDQEDCIVHCSGESACSFSTVICPQSDSFKCSLICNDSFSCNDMVIAAQNSMSLDINTNGHNALSFSKIYCPSNAMKNSCNITYIGSEYGLNQIDIYTMHNFTSINLKCNSTSTCWSNDNNPILNYGNTYSKTCIIYDINICTNIEEPFITTNTILNTSILISTISDHANDNILTKTSNYNQSGHYAFMLVSIGVVCGVLISICFCVFIYVYFTHKTRMKRLRIDQMQGFKSSSTKAIKLSPSLRQLSPRLHSDDSTLVMPELPRHTAVSSMNKHEVVDSMQVEVDTTMRLSEYIDYVDFVNEGLPNSFKETPVGSTTFIITGSSEDETPMGNTSS